MTEPYFNDGERVALYHGDTLAVARTLPDGLANCIVTSPPYFGLRDYGIDGQYGLEKSPAEYVETQLKVFSELRRVLANDGTLWLNIGDSYNAYNGNRGSSRTGISRNGPLPALPKGAGLSTDSLPAKNMIGIPWRVAFALQDDGWILRNDIIWNKPNTMPESVTDRLSGRYEHIFLFSKSRRYWFDLDAIREPHADVSVARSKRNFTPNLERGYPGSQQTMTRACHSKGKNPGDVWSISTTPFRGAHFAVYPVALPERCIKAACPVDGIVLDPYSGSGTTGRAALNLGHRFIGIDLDPANHDMALDHPKRQLREGH